PILPAGHGPAGRRDHVPPLLGLPDQPASDHLSPTLSSSTFRPSPGYSGDPDTMDTSPPGPYRRSRPGESSWNDCGRTKRGTFSPAVGPTVHGFGPSTGTGSGKPTIRKAAIESSSSRTSLGS